MVLTDLNIEPQHSFSSAGFACWRVKGLVTDKALNNPKPPLLFGRLRRLPCASSLKKRVDTSP
ncbi:hypothetical protein SAMN05444390_10616 [Marinobacterium lutimaris]|uniref:Uncharacterized protein n=1 Tax=Marinobacterium lutimaris TaxID=568106 RepID=A0A1H6DG30_9GAMM|nr:hypothetical protein SAMN05444390_10616 [Marinobacterium lutimaris]